MSAAAPGIAAVGGGARAKRPAILSQLASRPGVLVALAYVALLVVLAVFAPRIAPMDPNAQTLTDRLAGPSSKHLLGADDFGRDVLSRMIFGARVSMIAAIEVLAVSTIVGAPLGIAAGYLGGKLDALLSRAFDALMSMPALILAMTIVAVLGPGLTNAMLAVGIIFAPRYFRIARGVAMSIRHETYIEACYALGCSVPHTIVRHVLPNVVPPLIVQSSIVLGMAVTAEASLSFLGLGVAAPTASWGSMLATAANYMGLSATMVYAPGIAITLTVMAFMTIGQGISAAIGRTSQSAVFRGL